MSLTMEDERLRNVVASRGVIRFPEDIGGPKFTGWSETEVDI
jgi:hypothetical protein